jgi:hypothetical protein
MHIHHCQDCGATDGLVFDRDGQLKECKNCIQKENEAQIELKLQEAKERIESIELLLGGLDARRDDPGLAAKFLDLLGSAAELSHLWHFADAQSQANRSIVIREVLKKSYRPVELIQIDFEYEDDEVREGPSGELPSSSPDRSAISDGDADLFEDSEFGPGGYGI